jgi:hypothetical protein
MPSSETRAAIVEALGYSEDQLYEHIARAHNVEAGFKIGDIPTLVREGRDWWSNKEASLKPLVCGSGFVKGTARSPALDIAQAVYAALYPDLGTEAAVYACALIAKTGIAGWCDTVWRAE